MKAKDLARILMENPEAIVAAWDGEPNDVWVEVNDIKLVTNEYCQFVDDQINFRYTRVEKMIQLGYK